jgi:hypothetical protein
MDDGKDAELIDVGIKPSGEALVNVDVLTNELTKFFKSVNEGEVSEAPAGVHYIKVENSEILEALGILEKAFDDSKVNFELNDPNIIYLHNADNGDIHDAVEELQQRGIIIDETSIDSELQNEQEIEGNQDGDDEELSPEELANKHAGSPMREEEEEHSQEGDLDVGHQDDEPSMLGSTALETAEYAAKLYKKLQRYDNMDGEVDFPHWWQSKLVLAREYMSAAYHYLDSEEKQPALDQLALERVVKDNESPSLKAKIAADDFMSQYRKAFRLVSNNFGKEAEAEFKNIIKDKFAQLQEGDGMTTKLKPSKGDPTNMAYTDKVDEKNYANFTAKKIKSDFKKATDSDIGGIDTSLDPNEDRKEIISQVVQLIKSSMPADNGTIKDFIRTHYDDIINLGDDEAILDEFQEFLSNRGAINERLNGDQQEALIDLQNILDQAAQLGDEARSIIQGTFPEELRGAEAYDVFNFGSSSNSYDSTLESLISDIEQRFSEDEGDDLDEAAYDSATNNELAQYIINLSNQLKSAKANNDKKEIEHLQKDVDEVKAALARRKKVTEAGPGFAHDCAAKVVHEKYGKGTCIPEKHTLVKEGKKYVVTHYDVLFENNKTVVDIPVNELDIKTTNEHWHKGYKKKKK